METKESICGECKDLYQDGEEVECEGCLCKTCTPENPSTKCIMSCHG